MDSIRIGVLETKRQPGADQLESDVPAQNILTLESVFETPFDTDAHFTCYTPCGDFQQSAWPRINKPLLSRLRAMDVDLQMPIMVLDFDNPSHLPWSSPESVDSLFSQVAKLAEEWDVAGQWACMHTTKHGARIVFVLTEPLSVEEYESQHLWLCQQFCNKGILIDTTVSDWTRCFRAPFVVRDGEFSADDPCFRIEFNWERRLDPEKLGKAVKVRDSKYSDIRPLDATKPPDSVQHDILHSISPSSGRTVLSDWHKAAKIRLKNRECDEVLFGTKPIGDAGSRNSNIHRYLGSAIALLFNIPETTPEHIYALFLRPVQALEPDRDTPDWTDVLWDHICRLWAKEDAKERHRIEVLEQKQASAENKAVRIIKGMREWSDDPKAFSDDPDELSEYLQRRMLCQHEKSYYPMDRDGNYSGFSLNREQIIPWIRSNGMDDLIPTQYVTEDGKLRDLDTTAIVNKHAFPVREVVGIPQLAGGRIVDGDRLEVSLYRRNPKLRPQYSPDVDQWLMYLFGENYFTACKWIGYALAFEDGPICSLSLMGDPGVGKKLLMEGLSECLEFPYLADPEDIVSSYQYGLMKSPFLAVNEGWPSQRSRHPADTFRRLVGGDTLLANRKFHAPVQIKNPVRVIFAANNMDVVGFLTGGKDLSPEDREALQIRLLHFNVGNEAAVWLRSKGGIRYTKGWIGGDGGLPSDFTIAKHFLHLHATRADFGQPDPRLLVEGKRDSELMFAMRTQSGRSPLVVEAIIKLLSRTNRPNAGITIEEGKIFVLSSEILDYFRSSMASITKENLTGHMISGVLKGLVTEEHTGDPMELKTRPTLGRKRWYQIDAEMLMHTAQQQGWTCSALERLIEESYDQR